jgi:hypothetical protein
VSPASVTAVRLLYRGPVQERLERLLRTPESRFERHESAFEAVDGGGACDDPFLANGVEELLYRLGESCQFRSGERLPHGVGACQLWTARFR